MLLNQCDHFPAMRSVSHCGLNISGYYYDLQHWVSERLDKVELKPNEKINFIHYRTGQADVHLTTHLFCKYWNVLKEILPELCLRFHSVYNVGH